MKINVQLLLPTIISALLSCNCEQKAPPPVEQQLLSLEQKWLEYEFALDTASIAPMLDPSFISISANDTSCKKTELEGVYNNILAMRNDSIFIDSFRIEEPFIVNQLGNVAITIFICHTYKKDKGHPVQKRTKFYDVWIKRGGTWKAVSSQATTVEEIK